MRVPLFRAMLLGCSVLILLAGCRKKDDLVVSDIEQFNNDSNEFKSTLDKVDEDVNTALKDIPGFGKTDESSGVYSGPLCGVTIDSSELAQKILYFNFDGVTSCFIPARTRAGQIKVELIEGDNWAEPGAVLRQTFVNFKVVRVGDNRSIMCNGVKTLENLNGHLWIPFYLGTDTFSYRERALNMDVSFDGGQQAVWNSARTSKWSYTSATNNLSFVTTGDTTLNGHSAVGSWGVNRFSDSFTTYYTEDITSNTNCGLWRFKSGELIHLVNGNTYTLTLGVNQNGSPSTAACAYGFKVSWDVNGQTNSQVFSY